MRNFEEPQLKLHMFDLVSAAEGPSAYGQAWDALIEEGASQIGEADWNSTEEWSFGQ